ELIHGFLGPMGFTTLAFTLALRRCLSRINVAVLSAMFGLPQRVFRSCSIIRDWARRFFTFLWVLKTVQRKNPLAKRGGWPYFSRIHGIKARRVFTCAEVWMY